MAFSQECIDQRCLVPERFILAFLVFWSGVHAYLMRVNLSVAILAMTKPLETGTTTIDSCPSQLKNKTSTAKEGKLYEWDSKQQGNLLSAFFGGYVLTHMPGGIYAEAHGGKHTLGFSILLCAVCTFLTPLATEKGGYWALFAVRVVIGMGEGTIFPAMTCLMAHWIPKKERASLGSLAYSGVQIGTVMGNACTGVVLDAYGWPATFYMYGILAVMWYVLFVIFVYSSPSEHPFLTTKEKAYLDAELVPPGHHPIPWKKIFTNLPVWSLIICQFGHAFGLFSMVTLMPKYFTSILRLPIKESAMFSALPYLTMWFVSMLSGCLCDYLVHRDVMSLVFARKFFTTIAQVGPAIFILAATYAECNIPLVIGFFIIAMGTMGTFYAGMRVNCLDLAPNFSGVLMAIVNGLGAFSGVVSPSLCGKMTKDGTFAQWRAFFWINCIIMIVTNIVFCIFGSADIQDFNQV